MTVSVIECRDKALLEAFAEGQRFAGIERIEQGKNGSVHWLIVEDDKEEDNATYRLTRKGLRFTASGVEI